MHVWVKGLGWLKVEDERDGSYDVESDASVADVLKSFLKDRGVLGDRPLRNGDLARDVLVFLNGVDVNVSGGLYQKLHDGDKIVVVPVVHGG
ncbi:MAG: MoaD/ThiS family protein [Thermoprotei archaeon]